MSRKSREVLESTREKLRVKALSQWSDPIAREKLRIAALSQWADPIGRAKKVNGIRLSITAEWREKHRQAALGKHFSSDTKQKLREKALQQFSNPIAKRKYEEGFQNYWKNISVEDRKAISEKAKRVWRNGNFRERMRKAHLGKGHKVLEETKRKISAANKGHSVSIQCRIATSKAHKGIPLTEEHKKKISVANKGLRRPPSFSEKMRQIVLDRKPTWRSSIELALENAFIEHKLDFEHNSSVFGLFRPDFIFRPMKLIVEADGDYWHSLPRKIERDQLLDKTAFLEGWTVFHFTETRIKNDFDICVGKVLNFLRGDS